MIRTAVLHAAGAYHTHYMCMMIAMTVPFGDLLRIERERREWDQARLARELGVTQQTVSRWERGGSRPRRHQATQLADLLGVDRREFLAAAGYAELADRRDLPLPVRPLATVLSVDRLPPDRFEEFIAELADRLYPEAHVSRFGGQGHTQYGFDVVGQVGTTFTVGIQCKRHKQFGKTDVRQAVEEATLEVGAAVIALTRIASPDSRTEMAEHPGWTLWDIEDISRKVRSLPTDEAVRLVDTFFPGWCEQFLGIRDPGPWLDFAEMFGDSGSAVYRHDWQLVGRAKELGEITAFLTAPDRVACIVGRGGLGKTRLLRAVATAASGWTVRFLTPGADLSPEHFEMLPAQGDLLVIVDDAHDRSGLPVLLRSIAQRNPKAKVLISLRPYGMGPLASALRTIGLHPTDLPRWDLTDLTDEDAEALAGEALGEAATETLVRRLAHLTADCPLITVVGGVLISRDQLDPACLDHEDSVREEILRAFADVLVADPVQAESGLRRGVLDAVAILQPFRSDDEQFQTTLSHLVGVPYDRCVYHLRGLEDAGVLLRRGSALRVVPDLLGDVVLAGASFDERSGSSTGYVERAYENAGPATFQNVFVNASRVDWKVRHDETGGSGLTARLWAHVQAEFDASGLVGRRRLAEQLRRVAAFAPEQTLEFVRHAIDNPTDRLDSGLSDLEVAMLELHPWSYDDVLKELPALLRSVGYHLDHLPEALDLLWRLAERDDRETNPHSDHPMRVIRDLGELELGKPLPYNHAVIDAAERWLSEGETGG